MGKVLIIDNDKSLCKLLGESVRNMGHVLTSAHTLPDVLDALKARDFDIVFLNERLFEGSQLDPFTSITTKTHSPEVILLNDAQTPDELELAIKRGAWGCIKRKTSLDEYMVQLNAALLYHKEKARQDNTTLSLKEKLSKNIIGSNFKLQSCMELLTNAAESDANVLISGETGTGKELFARAIHENSLRSSGNFVVIDCTAIPEKLIESILFGYEKGTFTGADKSRLGLIAQADGGTLFLDEIGELPLHLQKSFLRVLQEHQFRPLGKPKEIKSNFRLIAASNRDLMELVRLNLFRKDLLFRVRSITIDLPPLRERPEDIENLAMHYIMELCTNYGMEPKKIHSLFLKSLTRYKWPGNVRELIHAMDRSIASAHKQSILFPKHLPPYIRVEIAKQSAKKESTQAADRKKEPSETFKKLKDVRETAVANAEKEYLKNLIAHTKGNIKKAGQLSGLSRTRLYVLLKKYHLSPRL